MKKWGLQGLILILVLAVVVGGCSSSKDAKSESVAPMAGAAADMAVKNDVNAKVNASIVEAKNMDMVNQAGSEVSQPKEKGAAPQPAASPNVSTGFTAGDQADGLNRKLIYKANLTMKVKDYGKAQSEVRDLVALSGGYIVQFSDNQSTHEQGGQFVLRIPAAGFSSFLKDLGKIENEDLKQNIQGQDVSEEYVDLQSRLKVKQVTEGRYLEFMQKATKTDDLVSFTNQLAKIQEEIEQIKGRMRYIDQNVSFSTVELRVYQSSPAKPKTDEANSQSLVGKASKAMKGSFRVLSDIFQGLVVFFAGALPVIAAAAVIGIPVWVIYKHKRKAAEARGLEAERMRREHNRERAGLSGASLQVPENNVQGTNTPSEKVEISDAAAPDSPQSPKDPSENK